MRWFKHLTCSFNDEKLSAVVDELGMEGYGFWWRMLEIVAEKMDENGDHAAAFSARKWGNLFGFSARKFEHFVGIFQKRAMFEVEFSQGQVAVSIPNLLKYRDEWTRKKALNSGAAPEKLRPSRARLKEKEREAETEQEGLTPSCAESFSDSAPPGPAKAAATPPDAPAGPGPKAARVAPSPQPSPTGRDDPPAALIPLPGAQGDYPVPQTLAAELAAAFPGVDVRAELAKARAWCLANPAKRKTARGAPRFLYAWMERAQNGGRSFPGPGGDGGGASAAQRRLNANRAACEAFLRGETGLEGMGA